MAMTVSDLADEITTGMGFSLPATTEVTGFAQAVVDGLIAAIPTSGGVPTPHIISGIVGAVVSANIISNAGYPGPSAEITGFGNAFATYFQASTIITYTGPPIVFDSGGTVSGLVGALFAAQLSSDMGVPLTSELTGMATAITDHIVANMQVESGVIS